VEAHKKKRESRKKKKTHPTKKKKKNPSQVLLKEGGLTIEGEKFRYPSKLNGMVKGGKPTRTTIYPGYQKTDAQKGMWGRREKKKDQVRGEELRYLFWKKYSRAKASDEKGTEQGKGTKERLGAALKSDPSKRKN